MSRLERSRGDRTPKRAAVSSAPFAPASCPSHATHVFARHLIGSKRIVANSAIRSIAVSKLLTTLLLGCASAATDARTLSGFIGHKEPWLGRIFAVMSILQQDFGPFSGRCVADAT